MNAQPNLESPLSQPDWMRAAKVTSLNRLLPIQKLPGLAEDLAATYASASPFPHAAIDGLFDETLIDALIESFPSPALPGWVRFQGADEYGKLQSRGELDLPPLIQLFISALNSATFLRFLEKLTGIAPLIPDPHLSGGGLHQTIPGGRLGIHSDFNYHEEWHLHRRLNVILYLNNDWHESWGGALELWDRGMSKCVQRYYPHRNRLVIFTTTNTSYHGHPEPLLAPSDRTRKSIALYYFSNALSGEEPLAAHSTLFQQRPVQKARRRLLGIAREIAPPVIWKGLRLLRNLQSR